MCLATVSEFYDHPSALITDGWKDVGDPKKPKFQMAVNGKMEIPFDKWITATDEHAKDGIKADDGKRYDPGFHAYADEKEIKDQSSHYQRVFLRGIICRGKQGSKTVVVAREMYLPSDKNGWPPKGDTRSLMEKAKDAISGNA